MKKTLSFLIILQIIPAIILAGTIEDSVKLKQAREKMIAVQIQQRGISDPAVLAAMSNVLRHHFVPDALVSQAYSDHPLPIGEGQTISQPYIVALMTESLNLTKHDRVLEIGTGSGYQAAVLAKIVKEVYTIEIKKKLYKITSKRLSSLGFINIETLHGDGYFGWQEKAPFDAIMITAAVNHIPPPLLRQLNKGGRLILPMGHPFSVQNLVLVTKRGDDIIQKQITGVLFVPMTGFALER
jgi:protein-L-isoaspartate(D-aspartate) O-methyltransferase